MVKKVNQPGVVSVNKSSSSFSLNARLPTILICLILATSPSEMLKVIATRLRSKGVTVVVTVAAYLPRLMYWRFSSCSALSSSALSKIRDSARPTCFKAFFRSSLLISTAPMMSIWEIAGRSSTMTISTSFSTSNRTSLKKPVAYNDLMAAAAFSSFMMSPTFTGR